MTAKDISLMKTIDIIAAAFLFVGGISWGLVGLFGFDLIASIFGRMSATSRIVYMLVGISAIYDAVSWKFIQKRWGCHGFFGKSESAAA
ncbi:MAG: DUF378 domain-containing protein [Desulfobacterales bacterium]